MAEELIRVASKPGITRDGTRFDTQTYVDGQWCRFQRGLPKKIGGYQSVTDTVPEIARGIHSYSQDDIQYLHIGHPNSLGQYQVSNGTLSIFNDRTPVGFAANLNNLWQFDVFPDTLGNGNHALVAHAAPNAANIDNSIGGNIWIGTIDAAAVLDVTGLSIDPTTGWNTGTFGPPTGGVVVSGNYLFAYGSDGRITYSQPNDLSGVPVEFNAGTQKFVKGMPLRGSGQGPAALFWALDSLYRATFISDPTLPDFAFDVIARGITILSSQSVIEFDGIYYWPGVDRWYMFNGVVREIPNFMNDNWFFDNVNFRARQKVFGMKIPRYDELWWCYPRGNATECTHAVVYNVEGQFWYDTPLPDNDPNTQGRTAGIYADVYQRPFMVDNFVTTNGRTLWQHETAFDKIQKTNVSAIRSFFETHEFNLLDQKSSRSMRTARVECDLVQAGDMTLTLRGRANAKDTATDISTETIFATPSSPDQETVKFKDVQRLTTFKFESNVRGGNYELGKTYAHMEPADGRVES